tara:strand:- start:118 stop:384 length:267 start_codon:yes stop_codon:yes gene_type:complete
MADTRVHVTLEDFLRVTIAERDEFDSVQDAADELGMTPASFKQRLIKSKKRYPSLYAGVDSYSADARKVPDEAEAAQLLASLLFEDVA